MTEINYNSQLTLNFLRSVRDISNGFNHVAVSNNLFTELKSMLENDTTTIEEVRSNIKEFTEASQAVHNFVVFSDEHEIHTWLNDYEENRNK